MSTVVYPTMVPSAQDSLQVLLVKATYYAQAIAEAAGGPFTAGMYPNMTPFAQDPLQVLAAKLAYWLEQIAIAGGGGGGGGLSHLLLRDAPSPPEAPPVDQTTVWFLTFRNGAPGLVWDPTALAWI